MTAGSSNLICYSGGTASFAAIQKEFSRVNSGFPQQLGLYHYKTIYNYGKASVMFRT